MLLEKLGTYLNLSARMQQGQEQTPYGICSVEEFRAVLDRERARANRNRHGFSLVVFEVGSPDTTLARRLLHVLTHRVRSIDEVGWFDRHRIGVILPYTLPAGACKLVDDLSQLMATKTSLPAYTVYTYPSRGSGNGDQYT